MEPGKPSNLARLSSLSICVDTRFDCYFVRIHASYRSTFSYFTLLEHQVILTCNIPVIWTVIAQLSVTTPYVDQTESSISLPVMPVVYMNRI